jgi:hypothetical protein
MRVFPRAACCCNAAQGKTCRYVAHLIYVKESLEDVFTGSWCPSRAFVWLRRFLRRSVAVPEVGSLLILPRQFTVTRYTLECSSGEEPRPEQHGAKRRRTNDGQEFAVYVMTEDLRPEQSASPKCAPRQQHNSLPLPL